MLIGTAFLGEAVLRSRLKHQGRKLKETLSRKFWFPFALGCSAQSKPGRKAVSIAWEPDGSQASTPPFQHF
jgi:hypothetical protein